jgi:hypothetical protein
MTSNDVISGIKRILDDDKNYPDHVLKIGAIWNLCDIFAKYRRFESTEGQSIEVIPHDRPT